MADGVNRCSTTTGSGVGGPVSGASGATGSSCGQSTSRPPPPLFVGSRRVSWVDPRMSETEAEVRDEQEDWWRFPFRLVNYVHVYFRSATGKNVKRIVMNG